MPTDQQYGPPAPPGYGQGPLDRAFQPFDLSRLMRQPDQATQVLQRNPARDQFQHTTARQRKKEVDEQYLAPGSFYDALHRAKKASGMGDGFDSLFQSSLWIRGQVPVDDSQTGTGETQYAGVSPIMKAVSPDQVKVAPEAVQEVAKLMRTPEGRAQLQKQVDDFKAAREQHYAATPKQEVATSPEGTAQGDTIEYENARKSNLEQSATGRATLAFEDATKNLSGGNPLVQIPLDIATQPIRAVNDLISMFEPDAWAYQQPGDRLGAAVNAAFGLLQGGAATKAVKEGLSGATVLREALGLPGVEGLKNPLAGAAQTFMGIGDAAAATPKLIKAMTERGVPAAEAEVAAKHIAETLAQATPEEVEKAVTSSSGIPNNSQAYSGRLFHGTKGDFQQFDLSKVGKSDPGVVGEAVYFTPDEVQAQNFAESSHYGYQGSPRVVAANVNLENPVYIIDGRLPDGRALSEIHPSGLTQSSSKAINKELRKAGYDGAVFINDGDVAQVAVFDTTKIGTPNEKATQEANALNEGPIRSEQNGQGQGSQGRQPKGYGTRQESDASVPQVQGQEEVATKQPWQMTQDEYLQSLPGRDQVVDQPVLARKATAAEQKGGVAKSRGFGATPDNPGYAKVYMEYGPDGAGYYYTPLNKQSPIVEQKWHHEMALDHALSEGKPVPPEVLADYPDLAAKYGKTNAIQNPETATLHGDVREPAVQGQKALPVQEGSPGVQQKAEEGQVGSYSEIPSNSQVKPVYKVGSKPWLWAPREEVSLDTRYSFEPMYDRTSSFGNAAKPPINQTTLGKILVDPKWKQEFSSVLDTPVVPVTDLPVLGRLAHDPVMGDSIIEIRRSLLDPNSDKSKAIEVVLHEAAHEKRLRLGRSLADDLPYNERVHERTARTYTKHLLDNVGSDVAVNKNAQVAVRGLESGVSDGGDLGVGGQGTGPRLGDQVRPSDNGPSVVLETSAPQSTGTPNEPVAQKYAASNAASNDLRAEAGLDPLQPSLQAAVSREQAATTYDGQSVLSQARQIVEDNRAGVRPPVPSQEEVLHMDMAAAEAGHRMNQAKQALADAIDSGADPTEARRAYDMAREDVDTLTLASKAQGTEQSRAFSARNSAYFEDLTPAGVYRDFTVAKGAKLTDAEARQAEEMGRRLQKAESDIEIAKAKAETARAQARIQELEQQSRVAGRRGGRASGPRTAEQITAQRQAAVERIKARFADAAANRAMADPFGAQAAGMGAKLLADIAPDVMEVVRLYAEEGIVKLSEVVARVRHHVGEDVLSEGDVQRIIAGDYEHPPVTRSEAAKQVAQWRKELKVAGVGQETALKKSIAEYEAKIKAGEFPARPTKPAIPDDLQKLYVKKEALKAEAASMRSKIQAAEAAKDEPLFAKIGREAFNAPRTLVASTDLSAGLNQGMFAAYSHPALWAKSNAAGLYALKNEENFFKAMGEVRANPDYDKALSGGLKIASDAPHFDPGGDMMLSKMLSASGEVDTRLGKIGLNPIAASERAYVATITKLRMDLFSNMVQQAEKPALFGLVKPQKLTLQDYKDIADWVNVATGAGTNGIARGLQHVNNHLPVIFSPGYMVSRWQLAYGGPGRLIKAVKNNPRVALEIAKDYSKFAGAAGGLLYAAKMSGADVELDPRSTAFGKVKVGDTTIDPFAGILAPYRVMTQVAVGSKQKNGGIMPPNAAATLGYYGTGKASPLPRTALNIASGLAGKDVFGKSYDPRTQEGLANTGVSLLPIQVQSQMDLAEDKSLNEAQKDALRILVLLGVNTQTDTPKETSRSRSSSRTSSRGRASLR